MTPSSIWNSLEAAKLLVSILTPLTIVILGFLFNRRVHELEAERDDARRRQEAEKEDARRKEEAEEENTRRDQDARERKRRDELERRHKPHIELDIDCRFFGPQQGKLAAEFTLTADNKGITRHEFRHITLRVRGIRRDAPLSFWTARYEHRLEFPEKIVEDEVKPTNWGFIFVEPGVTQRLRYMTIIDEGFKYITARAEFEYNQFTPHSTEKMFEVRPTETPNGQSRLQN